MNDIQGFGEKLKNRREERGLSLDDVSLKLRIRRQFVEALEEERWDAFPGETYLKGFLRSYAEFLNLDPRELLECYLQRRPEEAATPDQLRRIETELIESVPMPSSTKRSLLVLLLIILLAAALGYWLSRPISQAPMPQTPAPPVEQQPVLPSPSAPAVDEDVLPDQDELSEEGGAANVPSAAASAAFVAPVVQEGDTRSLAVLREEGSSVRVQADRATHLEVVLDGRPVQGYQLQAGAVVTWQARFQAQLLVQEPEAISLWVDQRPLAFGNRSRVVLTAVNAVGGP